MFNKTDKPTVGAWFDYKYDCVSHGKGQYFVATGDDPADDNVVVVADRIGSQADAKFIAAAGTAASNLRQIGCNAQDSIEALPEVVVALRQIVAQLMDHPDVNRGNSKVHYCYHTARAMLARMEEPGKPKSKLVCRGEAWQN